MRKNYTLLLLSLLFSLAGFAQGLEVSAGDSVIYGNAANSSDIVSHIEIRNGGSMTTDVKVTRRFNNSNSLLDSNAICWVVCFDTKTDTSITTITLAPGERSGQFDFSGHVYPDMDGNVNAGEITYIFYDVNNPSDSAVHTVRYELTASFSADENEANNWDVYPNPASHFLWIDALGNGNSNARIEFTDVLGRKVYTENFDASFGKVQIALDHLKTGIYIYGIYNGNQLIEKKKLVVRK